MPVNRHQSAVEAAMGGRLDRLPGSRARHRAEYAVACLHRSSRRRIQAGSRRM